MSVSDLHRVRRQQILREAEGYLELLSAFDDRDWTVSPQHRDRLAQRSLELLERMANRESARSHVLFLQGFAYRLLERYDEAAIPLEQAAELDPTNLSTWLLLGWCYKRCGKLEQAIQALEHARRVDSSEAIIHYNLACYWSLVRNVKQACQSLAIALDIDPNYRDHISAETDFDPIRTDPDFRAITSVIV